MSAKRKSYSADFKLHVVKYATGSSNRAAERKFGVSEKLVRDWRKAEVTLAAMKKTKKANRGQKPRWPELEERVYSWVLEQRAAGKGLSKVQLCLYSLVVAKEMNINDFAGGNSWCSRFMQRNHISMRTRTTKCQKLPADFRAKVNSFPKFTEKQGKCLACEDKEGKVPLDSLSSSRIMSYCDKHAPSSHKDRTEESSGAGPSGCSRDINSSSGAVSKRRLSSDDDSEEVRPVRNKSIRRSTEHLIDSNMVITDTGTPLFAPIEDDDFTEIPDSPLDSTLEGNYIESPTGSGSNPGSENQSGDKGGDEDDEDDKSIHSDVESQSLLAPVEVCINSLTPTDSFTELSPLIESARERQEEERQETESCPEQNHAHSPDGQTTVPSIPFRSSTPPSSHASKPISVTSSPPGPSSASSVPPEPIATSLLSSTSSPEGPPPDQDPGPEPGIDSASFWKNCNTAGCTQAMFSDFIKEMNEISERIQSDQASQTDYDRALKVMESSGQLKKLVTEQQYELQRKQRELEKAAAAMSAVVSALQR